MSEHSAPSPASEYAALINRGGVTPEADSLMRLALFKAQALYQLNPKEPMGAHIVKVLYASETGRPTLAIASNSYVVNGRLQLFGEFPVGCAINEGRMEPGSYRVWWTLDGAELETGYKPWVGTTALKWPDGLACHVAAQRPGASGEHSAEFSVAMARHARLLGKSGPWTLFPWSMLEAKARAALLKRHWPDVLHGAGIAEDHPDYQSTTDASYTVTPQTSAADELSAALDAGAKKDDDEQEAKPDADKEASPSIEDVPF